MAATATTKQTVMFPAGSTVTIHNAANETPFSVQGLKPHGAIVATKVVAADLTIDTSALPAGLYAIAGPVVAGVDSHNNKWVLFRQHAA